MLRHDDLSFIEEPTTEDVYDVLRMLPEIRQCVAPELRDEDEVGLRSLLEQPEVLSRAWCRSGSTRRGRAARRATHHGALRAA